MNPFVRHVMQDAIEWKGLKAIIRPEAFSNIIPYIDRFTPIFEVMAFQKGTELFLEITFKTY